MMAKQLTFEAEMGSVLDRFEARLVELRLRGLALWSGVLRGVLEDLVAARVKREKGVYQELMLLESVAQEVECAAVREAILQRVARAKGLISAVCFGLLAFVACGFNDEDDVVRRGSCARVRRVREECVL